MADLGVHGAGATIKVTVGSSTTTLSQVTSIGLPAVSVDDIDISTMDSVEKWRTKIPGMKDGGDLPVDCIFEKSNAIAVQALIGVLGTVVITINDSTVATSKTTCTFPGYLKAMGGSIPFEDKVVQTMNFAVAGKPVIT